MRQIRHKRRPILSILLLLSLGINVFLIGWVATQRLAPQPYAKPDAPPEVVADAIAEFLPPADAKILRDAFAARHSALTEARSRYLSAVEASRQVIGAPQLDRQALETSLAQFRASRQAEREIFRDAIMEALMAMSPEGRKAFVDKHLRGQG